jgi:mono/diheme cytochrome c family protein
MFSFTRKTLHDDSTSRVAVRTRSSVPVALPLAGFVLAGLLGFCLLAAFATSESHPPVMLATQSTSASERSAQHETLIHSLEGPDLFRAYCASCHGADAKGSGPAASALKAKVPDLTLLAKNHGGEFPSAHVVKFIAGDQVPPSHGSREMPVWGPFLHQIEADVDLGYVRMDNLLAYLKSIQSVQPAGPPSGASLYAEHCAACHGDDLKGTGPVPYPYRVPPDLTTLAQRHGGTFPGDYVSDVLQNGVVLPAHGPAQMPIWGQSFRAGGRLSAAQVRTRITALTDFIESQQAK